MIALIFSFKMVKRNKVKSRNRKIALKSGSIKNPIIKTAVLRFKKAYQNRIIKRTIPRGKKVIISISRLDRDITAREAFETLDYLDRAGHMSFSQAIRIWPISLLSPYNKKLAALRASARRLRLEYDENWYSNRAIDDYKDDAAQRFVLARLREQGYIIRKK